MRLVSAWLCASSVFACTAAMAADDPQGSSSQPFQLGEIVVTAPRPSQTLMVGSTVLTSEAIYQFDRPTLDQAADLMPGVYASNTGGPRNERLISVRGFNRFQVPLLIDGIRVFLPADNRLDFGRFLTPDVAEVQVAKGYVSVLDGPDGMGGEINLVTRKPTRRFEGRTAEHARPRPRRRVRGLRPVRPGRDAPGRVVRPGQLRPQLPGPLGPGFGLHAYDHPGIRRARPVAHR